MVVKILRNISSNSIQLTDMLVYVPVVLPICRTMMPPWSMQCVEDQQCILMYTVLYNPIAVVVSYILVPKMPMAPSTRTGNF